MRQLLPEPLAEVDPLDCYGRPDRPAPADRPWVLLNMVASIDGAASVDGVSGGLGGDADREVFRAIRAIPDAILVAAGTVRAEQYGPPRPSEEVRARRQQRGQPATPRLVIATRSADLDLASPLFAEAELPPLVIATEGTDAARLADVVAAGAEVYVAGADDVDFVRALAMLREAGTETLLLEGGPTLNGQLVAAGLVDEVCLTIAPKLVGGGAARIAHGVQAVSSDFRLAHVLELGGELCCRYVRTGSGSGVDAPRDTMPS